MKYRVINEHRHDFRVAVVCRLGVSAAASISGCTSLCRIALSGLKKDRLRRRIYKTRDLARADAFDCIEVFCNRTRQHQSGGL